MNVVFEKCTWAMMPHGLRRAMLALATACFGLGLSPCANPLWASVPVPGIPELCERAAATAATETGVPLPVLLAIALTETGRPTDGRLRPWPWTVNLEGQGKWFADRQTALAFLDAQYQAGKRSFDVGCFQINHRWHGQAFASIDAMFDPLANARYAARFLARLHAESGDWSIAAGAYHSRTPEFAGRYRKRFDRLREMVATAGADLPVPRRAGTAQTPPSDPRRTNEFPLLQAGAGSGRLGSLVPVGGQTAPRSLLAQR